MTQVTVTVKTGSHLSLAATLYFNPVHFKRKNGQLFSFREQLRKYMHLEQHCSKNLTEQSQRLSFNITVVPKCNILKNYATQAR